MKRPAAITIAAVCALGACGGPEPDVHAEGACDLLRDMQAQGADPADPLADSTWAGGISAFAGLSANAGVKVHGTQLELETRSADPATRVPVELQALDEACSELDL